MILKVGSKSQRCVEPSCGPSKQPCPWLKREHSGFMVLKQVKNDIICLFEYEHNEKPRFHVRDSQRPIMGLVFLTHNGAFSPWAPEPPQTKSSCFCCCAAILWNISALQLDALPLWEIMQLHFTLQWIGHIPLPLLKLWQMGSEVISMRRL